MRARARARAIAAAPMPAAAPVASAAGDARGGIVYGELWAFMAMAPEGWTRDPITMRNRGLQGLYYMAGTVYSPDSLHLYVGPSPKAPAFARVELDDAAAGCCQEPAHCEGDACCSE